MVRANGNGLCLTCHAPNAQTGPLALSIEAHTHHKPDSAGSQCTSCHMPAIEQTLGDVNVHGAHFPIHHSRRNSGPEYSESLQYVPCRQDPCVDLRYAERLEGTFAVADGQLGQVWRAHVLDESNFG